MWANFNSFPVGNAEITVLSSYGDGGPQTYFWASFNDITMQSRATTVPTMNEWGMIIFLLLAGLGAVYYLRRQKTVKS